jgi:hypothetical protein
MVPSTTRSKDREELMARMGSAGFLVASIVVTVWVASPATQPQPSIQGVWRNVERVIPAAGAAGDRVDPFDHVPVGIQSNVQPGLLIFTKSHYSRTTDTAVQPRPVAEFAIAEKPTVAELQARWGPFAANAGTYELSGTTLTLHLVVSKEPRDQAAGTFARLKVQLDGDTLSLTPVANTRGPIVAGVTSRYVRVE